MEFDFAVKLAVAALCLFLIVYIFLLRRNKQRSNVLICGISNAGKTVLFARLCAGVTTQTYVSIKENLGDCKLEGSNIVLPLVDIPGNERQRVSTFEKFNSTCRAIIFVIDSVTFTGQLKDVAEYAYLILSDPSTARVPILFACNKRDDTMAKSAEVIKSSLEKELNLLRRTQSTKLVTTEGAQLGRTLGKRNKDLEFKDLSQQVHFVEINVMEDVHSVTDWLAGI